MKHDSAEWRQIRNQKLAQWIGDPHAVAFFLDCANISEIWDDLIDQDKPASSADINTAFYSALITLPNNPFYQLYRPQLSAVMSAGIHAWLDSTELERGDRHDRTRAYVLRDWNLELLLLIVQLLHGYGRVRDISLEIRRFFLHETLEQYLGELP